MIASLVLKIKRRETPLYAKIYDFAKAVRKISFPSVYVIHKPLYDLSRWLINIRWQLQQALWAVPVFKTQCKKCGYGLRLPNGIPWISGNLSIEVGDDCNLAQSTIIGGKTTDEPMLRIGNRSQIGYSSIISVNELVEIGDDVMMAHNCFIADSDGHPIDIKRRRRHEAVLPTEVKPVRIGNNVWIGAHCIILKGVTIGDNSIIAANTVVTKNVPPNTIVASPSGVVVKVLEN